MINISIAMATYNGYNYIKEQLDSILNQTIPASEIVVCDDCSTDDTWSILSEYAKRYDCFKIIRNETNIGFLRNFEKAISLCSGDYIALCDQDDVWLPNHLQILYEGIGNKMCVVGDAELIDFKGNKIGRTLNYSVNLDYIPENDLQKAYFILFYKNPYHGCLMMFKRDFFKKALPLPMGITVHDIWFSILACFYGGIQPVERVVSLYRRHSKTITDNKVRKTKIRTLISHLLFDRSSYHSLLVANIKERIDELDKEQMDLLNQADLYFKRKKTFFGRIKNLFFDLKYYRLIFSVRIN